MLIGIISLRVSDMLEQFGFERSFEIAPSGREMIIGIIGTSAWVYWYSTSEPR